VCLRPLLRLVGVAAVLALAALPSAGYIHFPPPTLQKLCQKSTNVRVLSVKAHDKEKGVIIYEVAQTLKGKNKEGTSFRHVIPRGTAGTKPISDWVGDGKRAVLFTIEGGEIACGYAFIDRFCYSVDYNRKGDYWLLIRVDPEMAACYHGSAETLQKLTRDVLDGKEVSVPIDKAVKALTTKEREQRVPKLNETLTKNRQK
jgi:hypothetical protein